MTPTPKKTEGFEIITLPDGTEGKRWENGDIRRMDGTLAAPPDRLKTIRSPEQAAELNRIKAEKRRAAMEEGVMRGTKAASTNEALGILLEKRAEVALSDEGRAGNDAAKLVFQMLEAMPEVKKEKIIVHEHQISEKTLEFLRLVEEKRREMGLPELIDADFSDVSRPD